MAGNYAPNYYGGGSSDVVPLSSPATLSLWKNSDLLETVAITLPANWTVLYWTVKDGREVDKSLDTDALVQLKLTNGGDDDDGLQILNRAVAEDAALGSLTVNEDRTAVTISLKAAAIAGINWVKNAASHDFAVHTSAGGKPLLVPPGRINFKTNVTRILP